MSANIRLVRAASPEFAGSSAASVLSVSGVLSFAVLGSFAVLLGSTGVAVVAIGVMLTLLGVAALTLRAGGFTATVLPIIAINSVLLPAVLLWPLVAPVAIVSAQIGASQRDLEGIAVIGIVFTGAYSVGAMLVGPVSTRGTRFSALAEIRLPLGSLVLASALVLLVTYVGYGESLIAGSYLGGTGPDWAVIASNSLTPLAVIAACVAAFRPGRFRFAAILLLALWILVLFGRSSRSLAAIPAFLLFGRLMAGKRVGWVAITLAAVGTIVLLQLPLALRVNESGVGIVPLGTALLTETDAVLGAFDPAGILGNILFSAPLGAFVAAQPIPWDAFLVSISPLQGESVGWADVNLTLKVDATTPFNAIGEIAAQGWQVILIGGFLIGAILATAERVARSTPGVFGTLSVVLVLALTALYSVTVLQYNLRSSTRLLWYLLAGVILLRLLAVLMARRQSRVLRVANGQRSTRPTGFQARHD